MSTFKKASELIKTLVEGVRLEHGKEYYSLFNGWERTVGTDIASHSRVKEIEKGTLIVAVDHPGWAQMIHLKKNGILSGCRKIYPELNIRDLRIILDRDEVERGKGYTEVESLRVEEEEIEPAADREEFARLLDRLEKAVREQNTGNGTADNRN